MLKIYSVNLSWAGGIVTVAPSKEVAFERFKNDESVGYLNRDLTIDDLEEHEVADGVVLEFTGDR